MVAAQFKKLRNADRYWYENVLAPYPELLKEIKDAHLGDVIKRNTDVTTVDAKSFIKVVWKVNDLLSQGLLWSNKIFVWALYFIRYWLIDMICENFNNSKWNFMTILIIT